MKISPVRGYGAPGYPARPEVDAQPDLLRLLPRRWQTNAAVIAALTATFVISNTAGAADKEPATRVAPVFEHGNGRGSFGCVAVNPPVFLSEEEARQVIVDDAKKAGLRFSRDGRTLPKVEIPTNGKMEQITDAEGKVKYELKVGTQTRAISLDGLNFQHNIAFEFVSEQDLKDWESGVSEHGMVYSYSPIDAAKGLAAGIAKAKPRGTYAVFYDPVAGWEDGRKNAGKLDHSDPSQFVSNTDMREWVGDPAEGSVSSVYRYDLIGLAKQLREQVAKTKTPGTYAIFYDPLASWPDVAKRSDDHLERSKGFVDRTPQSDKMQSLTKDVAREQLREQVKDFIKWLKGQGVI